eukprot:gnl/TRDRNA2_/TRDRNA2_136122_c0_seq1.p1 gnl/TRDRNA2_/TRDRNA2_136122_c0~~gnl/TRDRNA2_/TRDRNA2_136122_c0_seq1.p1  ORF type:complete len:519 (+),score=38.72 gnl/TRDRNA2_/TRDRNA2_136122_c0_seq1:65-1621(+)
MQQRPLWTQGTSSSSVAGSSSAATAFSPFPNVVGGGGVAVPGSWCGWNASMMSSVPPPPSTPPLCPAGPAFLGGLAAPSWRQQPRPWQPSPTPPLTWAGQAPEAAPSNMSGDQHSRAALIFGSVPQTPWSTPAGRSVPQTPWSVHRTDSEENREMHKPQESARRHAQGDSASQLSSAAPADLSSECVVCLDEAATHAVIPCGHQVLCGVCADLYQPGAAHRECPICRGPVQTVCKIFTASREPSQAHRASAGESSVQLQTGPRERELDEALNSVGGTDVDTAVAILLSDPGGASASQAHGRQRRHNRHRSNSSSSDRSITLSTVSVSEVVEIADGEDRPRPSGASRFSSFDNFASFASGGGDVADVPGDHRSHGRLPSQGRRRNRSWSRSRSCHRNRSRDNRGRSAPRSPVPPDAFSSAAGGEPNRPSGASGFASFDNFPSLASRTESSSRRRNSARPGGNEHRGRSASCRSSCSSSGRRRRRMRNRSRSRRRTRERTGSRSRHRSRHSRDRTSRRAR